MYLYPQSALRPAAAREQPLDLQAVTSARLPGCAACRRPSPRRCCGRRGRGRAPASGPRRRRGRAGLSADSGCPASSPGRPTRRCPAARPTPSRPAPRRRAGRLRRLRRLVAGEVPPIPVEDRAGRRLAALQRVRPLGDGVGIAARHSAAQKRRRRVGQVAGTRSHNHRQVAGLDRAHADHPEIGVDAALRHRRARPQSQLRRGRRRQPRLALAQRRDAFRPLARQVVEADLAQQSLRSSRRRAGRNSTSRRCY